jgi:protoheme IX farnesyltransferase
MLTKPRIISLLLVTTVAPMFVAGSPGWLLVLIVLIGGYLHSHRSSDGPR